MLKKQLEISGITNYKTDSNMLIDFILNRVNLLDEKIKEEITIKNWKSKKTS